MSNESPPEKVKTPVTAGVFFLPKPLWRLCHPGNGKPGVRTGKLRIHLFNAFSPLAYKTKTPKQEGHGGRLYCQGEQDDTEGD